VVKTDPKVIKICLTNRGADRETPWAFDLGPAPGPKGSRKVRLANVPFMHAKPTWGDVIVVSPVVDDLPTWDRDGAEFAHVAKRIAVDGGRWAMIVDYVPASPAKRADALFAIVARACAELDVLCEGAWAPSASRSGRVYLAVPAALTDVAFMKALGAAKLPCTLAQIHPARPAPKPTKKAPKSRARR